MQVGSTYLINYIKLLLVHILIGVAVFLFKPVSKVLLLAIVGYFLIRVFSKWNRNNEVLIAAAYITGFEVFSRMTGGALTYEFAKYAVIMFLVIGMFFKGFNRSSWPYIIYLFLLVPGVMFSAINLNYESSVADAVGFNLSGPVALGISALYCYNSRITMNRLQEILLAFLLPIITTTAYLFLYTPDIRDVITNTASNFAASGGYGPNQVATVLGLGMFVLFTRLFIVKNYFVNLIDLTLLVLVTYRGIVTFSRGGIITAAICAVLFMMVYFLHSEARERSRLLPKVGLIAALIAFTWIFSSLTTFGLIDKRYANQDAAGREKEDLTSGRIEILNSELEAFYEYPVTGIGVGKVKEYRMAKTGVKSASHNEMSRLLSEHGLFGMFAIILLLIVPLVFRMRNRRNFYLFSFLAFWFFTINHSSMRIAAPAFIYGLALINLVNGVPKSALHRK